MTADHEQLDALIDRARGPESWDERFVRQGGTGRPTPGQEDPALMAERRAFYAAKPPAAFVHGLRRAGRFGAWWAALRSRPALGVWGALAASVALIIASAALEPEASRRSSEPVTRSKGTVTGERAMAPRDADVAIDVLVWSPGGAVPLLDGSDCRPGEQLTFRYDSGDLRWLWLGSIDGSGTVSAWYPDGGGQSIAIVPGRGIPLPGAVTLDGYVGPERLLAVFSEAPLDTSAVQRAAANALRASASIQKMGRLPLDGTAQASLVIRKVAD
ncbi:MAG: hypothetical protein AMXMBFR64_49610 [Myxococcales bacterium]